MYRVFLVDDEPFIVEGLSDGVDWAQYGLELCGTAENGQQALEKLKQVPADILITDISMPFMNGLELIREARRFRPELKVIILSGFNEFDYLKEGMRLGIENYLLKPIHFQELFDTLRNTVEKLNASREQADYSSEEVDIIRDNVLYRWIAGRIGSEQLHERARLLGFDLAADYVLAGIVRHKGNDELLSRMRRSAQGDRSVIVFRDVHGDYVAAFLGNDPDACRQKAAAYMSSLQNAQEADGCGMSLGSVERLGGGESQSYENAQKAQEYLMLLGKNDIAEYEQLSSAAQNGASRMTEMNWAEYGAMLLAKDRDKLLERIETDFYALQALPGMNPEVLREIAIEAMVRMKMETQRFKQAEEQSDEQHKSLFLQAAHAPNLEELLRVLKAAVRMSVDDLTREDKSPVVKLVLKHLETNFADDLSLKSLGHKFNVHPVYLGRLFQRETSEAFTEYLNKFRINKAKELLSGSSLKVHEVSKEVGYWEPSYFHKQFKKHVGVTPAEYKAMFEPLP